MARDEALAVEPLPVMDPEHFVGHDGKAVDTTLPPARSVQERDAYPRDRHGSASSSNGPNGHLPDRQDSAPFSDEGGVLVLAEGAPASRWLEPTVLPLSALVAPALPERHETSTWYGWLARLMRRLMAGCRCEGAVAA